MNSLGLYFLQINYPIVYLIDTFAYINISHLMDLKQLEKIGKALGDSNRLTILQEMASKGGFIQCAQISETVNLAQPSVSHHIKTLTEAGLIEPEKEGRCYSYKINRSLIKEYVKEISLFTGK